MKFLIPSIVLAAAGAFGLSPDDEVPSAPCDTDGCRVEIERTSDGTCDLVCYDATGEEACREEIACDTPCRSASVARDVGESPADPVSARASGSESTEDALVDGLADAAPSDASPGCAPVASAPAACEPTACAPTSCSVR